MSGISIKIKSIHMKPFFFLLLSALLTMSAFAQDSTFQQLLDYSRPGKNHALIGKLAGTWNFQDAKLSFVKGTLTRTPIYDGRFYRVDILGGKLQVPVADGKMKEENYQGMQMEGFDNGTMKFTTTSINNHIGSDIEVQTGTYDSTTKSFTYESETELIAGKKTHNRRILKMIDNNHYSEDYYEDQNGTMVKVRTLNYTKLNN